MRYSVRLFCLCAALTVGNCAAGLEGGLVRRANESAVQEPTDLQLRYSGQRGTVDEPTWPRYSVTRIPFNDSSWHIITYPGWSCLRLHDQAIMRNRSLQAAIIIMRLPHPDLELRRQAQIASRDGYEIVDAAFNVDARRTSYFTFLRPGLVGASQPVGRAYALNTDYRDANSGILLLGFWSTDSPATLDDEFRRIARNLVIKPRPGGRPCDT